MSFVLPMLSDFPADTAQNLALNYDSGDKSEPGPRPKARQAS